MAKGLSKSQFVAALSEGLGVSKKDAGAMYDKFVALVYKEVKEKGELCSGLGKLVKQHRARAWSQPRHGRADPNPAKTVVKFRVNKAAKEAIL